MGGETAEMPGHYVDNNFDLAGFSVGCVDEKKILNNENVKTGNVLLGIESSGPHSNGFSLIRKIINDSKAPKNEIKEMVNKALMPTILYPSLIMDLIKNFSINSISHITGGGLLENLPRSIPKDLSIEIDTKSWKMPKIFRWLQDEGNVPQDEMYRIFNCGIGMVLFVDEKDSSEIRDKILEKNYKCFEIGKVCKNKSDNPIEFI